MQRSNNLLNMCSIAAVAVILLQCMTVHAGYPAWPQDFKWSSAGIPAGYNCEQIIEAADTATWRDNYFCWKAHKTSPRIRWSSAGPIKDMRCTRILEKSDPHTWNDNYLCVPEGSPYRFSWSSSGELTGKSCIKWIESADQKGTWHDNFLCHDYYPSQPTQYPSFPRDFRWSNAGVPVGYDCTQILEKADPHTWNDNFFCWKHGFKNPGLRWSSAGAGYYARFMLCTHIHERSDPHTWWDNYLCRPNNSPYNFVWSSAGPVKGKSCLKWREPSDPHTWDDNYLCA